MTQMCIYFKTKTDVAQNVIDKFFSNFDFGSSFDSYAQAQNKYTAKSRLVQNNYWWLLPLFH